MYLVGFNGPPYSGKDTLARMLADHMDSQQVVVPVMVVALSMPLRRIAYQMVGQTYTPATYPIFKETIFPQFGCSGRQLMIDISESFLKLKYGKSILAQMLLDELKDFHGVALIADSGFQCEIEPLADAVGPRNLFIVQVKRPECTFKSDSREWVYHALMQTTMNQGSLDELRESAKLIYENMRDVLLWKL